MNNCFKTFFVFVIMACAANPLFAQTELPVNAAGKICFCDTLATNSLTHRQINDKILIFAKQLPGYEPTNDLHSSTDLVELKAFGFPVYIKRITQQISGKIFYDAAFHVSDGKVFYSFTNFLYNPYARNRYGKFVPESGKYKPLEEDFRGNTKTWEKHRKTVETTMENQIVKLKFLLSSP